MPHSFDQDIAVQPDGPGVYRARITERWNIMTVPNGGYLLAVAANALRAQLEHPDPFSVTGHFLKPVVPGPARIEVETLKTGKAVSFGCARLLQDDVECLRATGAFGALDQRSGPDHQTRTPPRMPPPDDCLSAKMPLALLDQVSVALTPASAAWFRGQRDADCELLGWAGFQADRAPDALSLLLFADSFPPPIFRKTGPVGWVPTLEMTVQVRAHPVPGPLQCRFSTHSVTRGYAEEDGEIWDAQGNLVALSRQLAAVRLPNRG